MKNLFLFFLLFSSSQLFAQDTIVKRDGTEISSVVKAVTEESITYLKFDNPTGPTYTLSKNSVFMIKYQNGSKDVFEITANEKKAEKQVTMEKRSKTKGYFGQFDYVYLHQEPSKTPVFTKKVMTMLTIMFTDLGLEVITEDNDDAKNVVHCYVKHHQRMGFGDKLELTVKELDGKTTYNREVKATSFTTHDDETEILTQKAFQKMIDALD